ncbi:MAG: Hydrolase superfamily protein, partial [Rhodospirillales bacterium]|nr:Hydrolase superfamily protein [Rhodospirillales bacterium]
MARHPPIRLLLADVDGTLVTKKKVLTDQVRAAVRDLGRAGILFAITSGRPPRGMRMLIEPLELKTPIAGFNGGVMTNPDLTVIETRILPFEAAQAAIKVILGKGMDAWVYTADQWLVRDPAAPHVEHEARTVEFDAVVVPAFTDTHLASAVKIVGVSDDYDLVAACEDTARKELGDTVSAARSQPYYLDVTHRDANKGAVVDRLSEMLSIPRESIATIGDMPNDTLMFARSGLSIAMGNASDQVKAQATEVTDSNEDEGLAKAVRRFILPAAPDRLESMTKA